jgi:hypothetical protein
MFAAVDLVDGMGQHVMRLSRWQKDDDNVLSLMVHVQGIPRTGERLIFVISRWILDPSDSE